MVSTALPFISIPNQKTTVTEIPCLFSNSFLIDRFTMASSTASGRDFSGSSHSTTLSEGITRALQYTNLDESDDEKAGPDENASQLLKRKLSTKSIISTTSSFASRMQKSSVRTGVEELRIIGLGSCGSVFEIPGTELVFKKGTIQDSLLQDFQLTQKVHNEAKAVRSMLQKAFPTSTIPEIPMSHDFHTADDEHFWTDATRKQFPADHRTPQPIFTETRILPLPQSVREALIALYFDEEESIQQEARDDLENKHCLIRVYLGERESIEQQNDVYSSLRNFPLRLNMMEDLDMDISGLAEEMAIGLAVLHWQAQVNAMDTEFVLGSSATWDHEELELVDNDGKAAPPRSTNKKINFQRRKVHLWMLDFDKASSTQLTECDVDKELVPGFLGNDPYFPMPTVDEELWSEFCEAYLKASKVILRAKGVQSKDMVLPQRFLDGVVMQAKKNEEWDAEEQVVFG